MGSKPQCLRKREMQCLFYYSIKKYVMGTMMEVIMDVYAGTV